LAVTVQEARKPKVSGHPSIVQGATDIPMTSHKVLRRHIATDGIAMVLKEKVSAQEMIVREKTVQEEIAQKGIVLLKIKSIRKSISLESLFRASHPLASLSAALRNHLSKVPKRDKEIRF
jgi:hypothetical protein